MSSVRRREVEFCHPAGLTCTAAGHRGAKLRKLRREGACWRRRSGHTRRLARDHPPIFAEHTERLARAPRCVVDAHSWSIVQLEARSAKIGPWCSRTRQLLPDPVSTSGSMPSHGEARTASAEPAHREATARVARFGGRCTCSMGGTWPHDVKLAEHLS